MAQPPVPPRYFIMHKTMAYVTNKPISTNIDFFSSSKTQLHRIRVFFNLPITHHLARYIITIGCDRDSRVKQNRLLI